MKLAKGKLGDIVQHCIYEIATGKWEPGAKLPAVRKGEKLWGVNRLTVLAAYRELEKMGLVVAKDRSGYYVAEKIENEVASKGLQALYSKIKALIKQNTDIDFAYTLRYFHAIAASEARVKPTYAFLECTSHQAEDHANEIYQKLNVFVQPISLPEDHTQLPIIPVSVETLLTTSFHVKEVAAIGKQLDKTVVNIPIEVDPRPFGKSFEKNTKVILVELEGNMSSHISSDMQQLIGQQQVKEMIIQDLDKDLAHLLENTKDELLYLSPRVWGKVGAELRKHKRIQLIRFRISDVAWKTVSRALKVPI